MEGKEKDLGYARALDVDRTRLQFLKVRSSNSDLLQEVLGIWQESERNHQVSEERLRAQRKEVGRSVPARKSFERIMQYVLGVKASMATEQVRKSDNQVLISPPPIVLQRDLVESVRPPCSSQTPLQHKE